MDDLAERDAADSLVAVQPATSAVSRPYWR